MFRVLGASRAASSVRRPFFSLRNVATAAGMLSLAVLAGAFLSGGTFAYLNATTALPSATIVAGSARLTTSGSPIGLAGLYPGFTQSGLFTITNNGDVPLVLNVSELTAPSADAAGLSSVLTVRVDPTNVSGTCATLPATATFSSTFAATPPTTNSPANLGITVASGASTTLCLSVRLPTSAANTLQGKSTNAFTVTIGGVQS
jgi:hypothetical protein